MDKNSSQNTGTLLPSNIWNKEVEISSFSFSPIYFLLPTLYYLLMFGGNKQRESLHNALRHKKIRFNAGGIKSRKKEEL